MHRNCLSISKSTKKSKIIKFHIEISKSYLNTHFIFLCFPDPFFLLIFLFHYDEWQLVLNSINFTSLQSRRINIPGNKGHQECLWGLKSNKRIQLESWRDWWQWWWEQRLWSSRGSGSDSTLCPQTNILDPWGSSGHPYHKQQHSRQQKHNLTAHKEAGEPVHIVHSCLHSIDNRLNPDQLGHKQSH